MMTKKEKRKRKENKNDSLYFKSVFIQFIHETYNEKS